MRIVVVCGVALLALTGCLHRKELDAANSADAACKAQNFRTEVELVRCRNAATRLASAAYGSSGDVVELGLAQRTVLAEKLDRGQITRAEYDLELAKTRVALEGTIRERGIQDRLARGTSCRTYRQFNNIVTDCN